MSRENSHRAFRYARELARCEGMVLRRFRMIPGTDDSEIGREWSAESVRCDGIVVVWLPIGEDAVNECLRSCTVCRSFGGRIFGISIRGGKR